MPESRISLPADVTDALSLRRTLSAIIDEINTIIGAKGVDPYVKESDLPAAEVTLTTLNTAISKLTDLVDAATSDTEGLEESIEELEEAVALLRNVTEYDQASSAMSDFNDVSWSDLEGLYQLEGLGSSFTNPPEVLDDTATYNVYAQSFKTLGNGRVQEVIIENTDTNELKLYKRAANSFTQLLVNGWFNVQSY